MGVEAQYEKGFCFMLTLFSHINAHTSSRPHSILRTSSDTLIVLSRARSGSVLQQDLCAHSGGPGSREQLLLLGWALLPGGPALPHWNQGHRLSPDCVCFPENGQCCESHWKTVLYGNDLRAQWQEILNGITNQPAQCRKTRI